MKQSTVHKFVLYKIIYLLIFIYFDGDDGSLAASIRPTEAFDAIKKLEQLFAMAVLFKGEISIEIWLVINQAPQPEYLIQHDTCLRSSIRTVCLVSSGLKNMNICFAARLVCVTSLS